MLTTKMQTSDCLLSISSSGGHFVQQSGTDCAILEEGISVKLY